MTEKAWPLMGYAPGFYMGKCLTCGGELIADKRATQCLECAVRSAKAALTAARNFPAVLEALSDCADDLESEVRDRWCYVDGKPHPANERRFERDMEPVNRARELIAAAQGIDTRRAETGTGSVHESPVGPADAP